MDIQEIKLFLRIEHDAEDEFIKSLKLASEIYLKNAGCDEDYGNELYKYTIKLLISHWYDNRCLIGNSTNIQYSLDSIIYQLKNIKIKDEKEEP